MIKYKDFFFWSFLGYLFVYICNELPEIHRKTGVKFTSYLTVDCGSL